MAAPNNIYSVEDVFKNKNITFEDIDKLNYKQFQRNTKAKKNNDSDAFHLSDILDINDNTDSDDEILQKFKQKQIKRRSPPLNKKYRQVGHRGIQQSPNQQSILPSISEKVLPNIRGAYGSRVANNMIRASEKNLRNNDDFLPSIGGTPSIRHLGSKKGSQVNNPP